jgi:uncharacterized membrane protein YgdD (TMEM256/DUF423 family)
MNWKIGALNVALTIIVKAIGGHKPWDEERKNIFIKASQLHITNAIGIMLLSLKENSMYSLITCFLLLLGILLFSGTGYYRCFKDDKKYNHFMPIGGMMMIVGWIMLAFI